MWNVSRGLPAMDVFNLSLNWKGCNELLPLLNFRMRILAPRVIDFIRAQCVCVSPLPCTYIHMHAWPCVWIYLVCRHVYCIIKLIFFHLFIYYLDIMAWSMLTPCCWGKYLNHVPAEPPSALYSHFTPSVCTVHWGSIIEKPVSHWG